MDRFDYTAEDLVAALHAVGVQAGDVVFCHSNVGFLGWPREGRTREAVFDTIFGAFMTVLGNGGTLVVPTFTYSFARGQSFDPDQTPSPCGLFSEMVRRHPAALRSHDPNFSVAAIGARAEEMTADVPADSFCDDAFFARFLRARGRVCNINLDAGSTFVHYVEKRLRVPYRYEKEFLGTFVRNGTAELRNTLMWVQDLSQPLTVAAFEPFDALARDLGVVRQAAVGKGSILSIAAEDTERVIREALPTRPWLLTACETMAEKPSLAPSTGGGRFALPRPSWRSMAENAAAAAEALQRLPRQGVCPGVDAALAYLAALVPMSIFHRPTGTRLGHVLVPERWELTEARVEDADGTPIDVAIPPHSRSFSGTVSRDELTNHLMPPGECLLGRNEWGISGLHPEALSGYTFAVKIATRVCFGAMSYAIVPGAGPVLSCDLGGASANLVAGAVAAFRQYREEREQERQDSRMEPASLLIYPRPFAPRDLTDDGRQIVPIETMVKNPAVPTEVARDVFFWLKSLETD